jgi:hypothetical protein
MRAEMRDCFRLGWVVMSNRRVCSGSSFWQVWRTVALPCREGSAIVGGLHRKVAGALGLLAGGPLLASVCVGGVWGGGSISQFISKTHACSSHTLHTSGSNVQLGTSCQLPTSQTHERTRSHSQLRFLNRSGFRCFGETTSEIAKRPSDYANQPKLW